MDPVARVWDVLDVSVREQPLDFRVIVGAGSGVKTQRRRKRSENQKKEGRLTVNRNKSPLYKCK